MNSTKLNPRVGYEIQVKTCSPYCVSHGNSEFVFVYSQEESSMEENFYSRNQNGRRRQRHGKQYLWSSAVSTGTLLNCDTKKATVICLLLTI